METALEAHSETARQTKVADSGITQWKLPWRLTVKQAANAGGRWWNHTVETALEAQSETARQTKVADTGITQWKLL